MSNAARRDAPPGSSDRNHGSRGLALALLDAGRPAESVVEARRAVALRPEDALGHTLLGQGLVGIGQPAEAVTEFERAIELDPSDADARRGLAELRGR